MKNAIGGLVAKIKKKKGDIDIDKNDEDKKIERSEIYESKYVKDII